MASTCLRVGWDRADAATMAVGSTMYHVGLRCSENGRLVATLACDTIVSTRRGADDGIAGTGDVGVDLPRLQH